MASQCRRQQCTIDRRGFRQELDSWRHKLIHCVGFESILEGLFSPALVEDLQLFKDSEPVAVSDWSFDENCLFCCLRRDKVKEHLIGLSKEGLEDAPKPLLEKDQTTISRLEKQAEEFLNAVLYRKDVPNLSDPLIPVVAREILQRMIRQFAAEYTSKTSPSQDSCSDSQPLSDQSPPPAAVLSGAPPSVSPGPAHNQNPVLSKLLMADQDAPLDLTIKKPPAEPSQQDGVLDLSIKKNRYNSNPLVCSPCPSPASSALKGESPDIRVTKARDLQSTSTLENFMAKLCPHHQKQIVDAIGFLQTEVKVLSSSNTQQAYNPTSAIQGTTSSTAVTPDKLGPELRYPRESTPRSAVPDTLRSFPVGRSVKAVPLNAGLLKTAVSSCPALDLCSPVSRAKSGATSNASVATADLVDTDSTRQGDHAPLKMKIMTSNVADGKKLSCVLNSSLSSPSDSSEDRQGHSNASNRTDTHSARLSSTVKRPYQVGHTHHATQIETRGNAKDSPVKLFSVHMKIPSESQRTARKTFRASSDHRISRDTACRGMIDPDLGHCDIVFIDKPITECFKEQRRNILPRRNARKSTRGHMYSDEIWELKTVRTLAGRGHRPNPMPELITLVTPKQTLSKPEGLPPVDMPLAGARGDTMNQHMSEESDESLIPGTGDVVEVADSEVDVIVETSQTDQSRSRGQTPPPSPAEKKEIDIIADVAQDTTADSGTKTANNETLAHVPSEATKNNEPEPQEDRSESTNQTNKTIADLLENVNVEEVETEVSSDNVCEQERPQSPTHQVEEKGEEVEKDKMQDEKPQEFQPGTHSNSNNSEVTGESNITASAKMQILEELELETSEAVEKVRPPETKAEDDSDYDVSSKTLDALLKELPPWRRKKGVVTSLPNRIKQTNTVIVGYVNGRPISASDRSLRRRSSNSTAPPNKCPVKSSKNVANKTSADLHVESPGETKPPFATCVPINTDETTPKVPQRAKQMQKQKKIPQDQDSLPDPSDQPVDSAQSSESKRQLRSSSLKPPGSPVSLPCGSSSTSSPEPTTTQVPQSIEERSSLQPPLSHPASPPLVMTSCQSATSPVSSQNFVPDTVEEMRIEKTLAVETASEEIATNEEESESPAKLEQKSAKIEVDVTEHDEQQLTEPVVQIGAEACNISLPQTANVESLQDRSASEEDCNDFGNDKPTRMPLRSEGSKAEMSHQSPSRSPPLDTKKLALRSQATPVPSTSALTGAEGQGDVASPIRIMPERITKTQGKSPPVSGASVLPHSSAMPVMNNRPQPPKPSTNKFFEALTGEDNQHLLTSLNTKYDKMQKGWVQMDKEGQPITKYKNKSDRQAAIWKSKRRARKHNTSVHQKYSPVQMLFMKGFNLSSICRWFLESTETKSLVIVKKVNTRLPSETQLCFHSSSSASGTSQGVFPSLQAERLKKHLKKFAIASPVKSTPRSQKLIAKALEQEGNGAKGKECTTQALSKSSSSAKTCVQICETQKASGKSKNPASARILRKYSNIRGKMQVQQSNAGLKKASKTLKANNVKKLAGTKSAAKSSLNPSQKSQNTQLAVSKQRKENAAKMERRNKLVSEKTAKLPQERVARTCIGGRASRDTTKNVQPKRSSQRLGSPKVSEENLVDMSKSKIDNKKPSEVEKAEVEKSAVNKVQPVKVQSKEPLQSTLAEIKVTDTGTTDTPQQSLDDKGPTSTDQVLTRSQRKIEAAAPGSGSPSHTPKRATKVTATQNAPLKSSKKSEERRGAVKAPAKRGRPTSLPRSATKSATKRAQDLLETPAKRTRTSLTK